MSDLLPFLWPWLVGALVLIWLLIEIGGFGGGVLRRLPRRLARARHRRQRREAGGLVIDAPHELAAAIENGVLRAGQRLEVNRSECRVEADGYTLRFAAPRPLADGSRYRIAEVRRRSLALEQAEEPAPQEDPHADS